MTRASLLTRFRRRYGASPWHLAGHLLVFAVAGFAIDRIASAGSLAEIIGLYVGFAILHDLVLLPAYSGLDRVTRAALARLSGRGRAGVPAINHVRAPGLISALLLALYAPLISGKADGNYLLASGHHATGYLRNWLLISAVLFGGSGLVYALRVWRVAAGGPPAAAPLAGAPPAADAPPQR